MSGKGDNTIKDTPERRHLAQVGAEQWNYAQQTLAPLQDQYMAHVDTLDSAERKSYIEGQTNIGMQNALGSVTDNLVTTASAHGLDLGSGKTKGLMLDSFIDTAEIGGDTSARALFEQDRQKAVGLQNVVAIGSGQEARSMAGLADISEMSSNRARNDAVTAFNRRSANLQTLGSLAGAGTAYYMNNQPVSATQMRMQDGGGAMVNNGNNWNDF